MPKCPKCGMTIDYLLVKVTDSGTLTINKDGSPNYEMNYEVYGTDFNYEFKCPECDEVLFTSPEKAEEFLTPKAKQTTLT